MISALRLVINYYKELACWRNDYEPIKVGLLAFSFIAYVCREGQGCWRQLRPFSNLHSLRSVLANFNDTTFPSSLIECKQKLET